MTFKRSILHTLIVGLVSSMLLFPVVGLKSSLAQAASYEGTACADTPADVGMQGAPIALAEGVQCPANTTAYWKLDERHDPSVPPSERVYYDSYDGHHAMCAGACPFPVAGQVNGGQAFDLDTTGLDVPAHADFDWGSTQNFSIEFWMRRSGDISRNEVIVGRDDTPTSSLHWWVGLWKNDQRKGLPVFYLVDTGGTAYSAQGTTILTDGAWHHIVAVRHHGRRQLRLYVDGVLETTTESVNYPAGFGSSTAGVNIGWIDRASTTHKYRFGGIADEVAIYETAMGDADVAEHYAWGLAGHGPCSNPSIAVDKTADPTIIYAGDTVAYSYAVTNDGDISLLNVNVTDDKCSPLSGPQGGDGNAELSPGEVWSYTCSMALAADTTNTVTATGTYTYPMSGTTSGTDTRSVDVIAPGVVVDKTANPAVTYPGTTVTYNYTVTNQGNDPLSSVRLSDDKCSPVTTVVGDGTLSPGETQTYTCSKAVSQDTTNTATFAGTDLLGKTWSFTDTAFVDVLVPDVTVVKTANPELIYYGETVTYNYAVTNQGNDPLSNVTMSDDKCSPVTTVAGDGTLSPGETQTYTCATPLYGDTTNIGTFSGSDSLGRSWQFTDTAFVDMRGPQIAVAKTASAPDVRRGETVLYTYDVTNPGGEPLSNVRVEDDKCSSMSGPQGDVNSNNKLDMNETWTYTCSMALYHTTTNTAIAYGIPSTGREIHSSPVQVTVKIYAAYLPIILSTPQS